MKTLEGSLYNIVSHIRSTGDEDLIDDMRFLIQTIFASTGLLLDMLNGKYALPEDAKKAVEEYFEYREN